MYYIKNEQLKKEIQGLLGLATYYEIFINEMITLELGDKYHKSFSKASIPSKWLIVTKKLFGCSIDADSHYFEAMSSHHFKISSVKGITSS